MKMVSFLNQKICQPLGWVAGALLAIIIFLVTGDVIVRFLFGRGIFPGVVEVNEALLVGAAFLGLAWTQIKRGHVYVEFVAQRLSLQGQSILTLFAWVISFFFCCFLAYASWLQAWQQYIAQEARFAGTWLIPIWPPRFILAFSVTLLCLILLIDIITVTGSLIKKRGKS